MRILHITPHLGGGIGKAHAEINRVLPKSIEQTFALLEPPIDKRHANSLSNNGAKVVVSDGLDHIAKLARQADIVQFEFINHPRMFECLARAEFGAIRCVIWAHISGLFKPLIAPRLIEIPHRFVFSSEISRKLSDGGNISVINSGFGFAKTPQRTKRQKPVVVYLGTVDFVKMHPGFLDAIDSLDVDCQVYVLGHVNKEIAVLAENMKHPDRIKLCGKTEFPASALSLADIFFYPLQPQHYGTGENSLVEAMSMGLVPVVMDNPAELQIVQDGKTGLIGCSIEQCRADLELLLLNENVRDTLSRNAIEYIAATRSPSHSADDFMDCWDWVIGFDKRHCDFQSAIGSTPVEWFISTQGAGKINTSQDASKGSLAHFAKVFSGDQSFLSL